MAKADDNRQEARRAFWPKPIGAFLFALVAVVLVPAVLFSGYLLQRNSQAQSEIVGVLAEATAGSIAETLDREITSMMTTLRVISTANSLGSGDYAEFYLRARAALLGTDMVLQMADADAALVVDTSLPFGATLSPIVDPEPVTRAQRVGEGVVSNAYFNEEGSLLFSVVLPWSATGENLGLILARPTDSLTPALTSQNLRGGWNAAVIDGRGIVLASSYISSDIGSRFFLYDEDIVRSGAFDTTRQVDGIDYRTVAKPLRLSSWRVVLWAPAATFEEPVRQGFATLVAGALAMALLGALGAWLLARQIAKPVRRLAEDARKLGAGERVEAVNHPVTEIAVVSQALAQASCDRQAAENEVRFLMREVAHRSKNQLTVVSSIAKQTGRNARSFADFEDAFQKRIHGLARSTDLLIAGGVAGVELKALVEAQLEPFRPDGADRCTVDGPLLRLSNQAAQTFGMVLHELATNAAKYGAFSVPTGKLAVEWTLNSDTVEFVWREHVPRRRKRAEGKGFGTEVLNRMLTVALSAEVERNLTQTGLTLRIVMPIEAVSAEAGNTGG